MTTAPLLKRAGRGSSPAPIAIGASEYNPDRRGLGLRIRTVHLSAGDIAFIDEGSGPALLLLHGAPITSLGFLRVVHALKSRYRVIAPDLPGFGGSIASTTFSGSLTAYAAFVEDFCRALELRDFFAYLNDSSACIGLPALANLSNNVAGLVVADTVPIPMTGHVRIIRFVLTHVVSSAPVRFLNRRLNLLPWMVVTIAPFLKPFSHTERRVMRSQFDTPEKRDRVLDLFHHMGRDEAFITHAAARARECFAATPVLLLSGQFDPMRLIGGIPRLQRLFPTHTVRIISFEEHFPILASGERVARVVHEWIQQLPDRRVTEHPMEAATV